MDHLHYIGGSNDVVGKFGCGEREADGVEDEADTQLTIGKKVVHWGNEGEDLELWICQGLRRLLRLCHP
jgi:hypothetical protein